MFNNEDEINSLGSKFKHIKVNLIQSNNNLNSNSFQNFPQYRKTNQKQLIIFQM